MPVVQIPPISRFWQMISFYFNCFCHFQKSEKNGEKRRKPEKISGFPCDIFFGRTNCLREGDLNHPVLHFLCGENAAVGSAALTAHRAVIHSRLTLRVMSPDRFADRAQPEVVWIKPREKNKSTLLRASVFLAGGGFEPPDLRVIASRRSPSHSRFARQPQAASETPCFGRHRLFPQFTELWKLR